MSMQRKIRRNMERTEITAKNKVKKKEFKHRFDKKKAEKEDNKND